MYITSLYGKNAHLITVADLYKLLEFENRSIHDVCCLHKIAASGAKKLA